MKTAKERAQAKRFIEAGCSEDEAEIRENMKKVTSFKPKSKPEPTRK